jgi:hypothetical protein
MKKGSNSITEYINKVRILADEMALAGKKIDNEELISYIFIGLGFKYNSIVSALVARPSTLSIGEVYSQLLSYEQCIDLVLIIGDQAVVIWRSILMIDAHAPALSILADSTVSSTEVHPTPMLCLESISDLPLGMGSSTMGGGGLAISAGDNNTLCHHNLQHCQNLHQALLLALLLIKHRNHRLVCKEVYAKTKNYTYGTIKYGFLAASGEPSNLEDALHDKNWKHAMDDEYEALIKNKT